MRRYLPVLLVAVAHFVLTRWLFEYSGGQMRSAIFSGSAEDFGGFALFMGVLLFALPSTTLAGLFSRVGAEGPLWDTLALAGGSAIWAGLVVGFWQFFLRPSDRRPRPARRPGDGLWARWFDRDRVDDPEWLRSPGSASSQPIEHTGRPPARAWLRVENTVILVAAVTAYFSGPHGWGWFLLLFLVPDLAALGYMAGPRVGAACYNLTHTYAIALPIVAWGALTVGPAGFPTAIGLIWTAHIAADRAIGYGLKSSTGPDATHLGPKGRLARAAQAKDDTAVSSATPPEG